MASTNWTREPSPVSPETAPSAVASTPSVLLSDYYFFQDYRLAQYRDPLGSFLSLPTEAISQLYLTGVGNRSFFDVRTIYYLSYSGNQSQVPIIHPVLDYSNVINHSIFGGEVSYKTNFTSLTRDTAAFDPITTLANTNGLCTTASADPLARLPTQCLLRGMPGTYTRLTGEAQWRRSFTDSAGEIWTPFAIVRADAIDASISNQPGVSNFLPVGDTQALRVMPTVGLEYRYPFINVQPWGTTTVEPIAQVIIRPNEPYAGKLPNEDAQSLVAICSASTNSQAMTVLRAAAAPMSACRRPRSSTAAAPSKCCSDSPINCSV